MKPEITKTLLERFYNGTCTKEERELVWRWLKSSENEDEVNQAMKEHWYALSNRQEMPETDFESLYENIHSKLTPPPKHGPGRFPKMMKLAAAITAILMIAGMVYYQFGYFKADVRMITGFGESKEVQLPDGSVIRLNTNSELKYARNWDNQSREVWLEGEAFFSIAHLESDQNFIVHTEEVSIEVLGTEFNVHNRRGDTKVVLNSGKVALNIAKNQDTTIIMSPGELVEYSASQDRITSEVVDAVAYSSWINKKLTFNKTKLSEIRKILEDDYGLSVVFEDSSQTTRELSGAMSIENVDVFLNGLSESLDITITRTDNIVVFEK